MSKELAAVELAKELARMEGVLQPDGTWTRKDPRMLFNYYSRAVKKVFAFDPETLDEDE